jgi:hypothetical protein
MVDTFPPTIAPQSDSSGNAPEQVQQSPDDAELVPITEQEVGEYREQDRYLPVSPQTPLPRETRKRARASPFNPIPVSLFPSPAPSLRASVDRKCVAYHEERRPANGKNREGRKGVRAGVRVGVHQLHHVGSGGEMPAREAQDDRRRGHPLRDGRARL